MIPQTDKAFIGKNTQKQLFFYAYTHKDDASKTLTITNPNAYAIDIVVSLNAGSGDTNTSGYESARRWDKNITYTQYLYTNAGRVGTSVSLKYKGKVLIQAGGGAGTRAGALLAQRTITRWETSKRNVFTVSHTQHESIGAWSYKDTPHCRQEGESCVYILTLPPKQSAEVIFTHNGATLAPFKGSLTLSAWI